MKLLSELSADASVSNEQIVEIAFGIVLNRIRQRQRSSNNVPSHVTNKAPSTGSHGATSHCVRTFCYECNEVATASETSSREASQVGSPRGDRQKNSPNSCRWPSAPAPVLAAAAAAGKDAATLVTPQQLAGNCCCCYYMRSDTRSRDTAVPATNQAGTPPAGTTSQKLGSSSSSSSGGSTASNTSGGSSCNNATMETAAAAKARTFRVKIDQEQLNRALGSSSPPQKTAAGEFPAELFVDVNCDPNCRVTEVSLKRSQRQRRCILALNVDSAGTKAREATMSSVSAAEDSPGTAVSIAPGPDAGSAEANNACCCCEEAKEELPPSSEDDDEDTLAHGASRQRC